MLEPVTVHLADVDPALRDEVDLDPLVEQMTERLRVRLGGLAAIDEFGRPLPWRQVVRLALGPALVRLRENEPVGGEPGRGDDGASRSNGPASPEPVPAYPADVVIDLSRHEPPAPVPRW